MFAATKHVHDKKLWGNGQSLQGERCNSEAMIKLYYHVAEGNLAHFVPVPPMCPHPLGTSEMDVKEVLPFLLGVQS